MNQRLLLIDGCEQVLNPFKKILEWEGYEVFAARTDYEALQVVYQCRREGNPIRVIVYDPQISQDSFFFLAPGIPSVIMHYHPDLKKAVEDQFGSCRFLRKPFGREEISTAVAEAMREANAPLN